MNLVNQQLKKLLFIVIAASCMTGCDGSSNTPATFFEGIQKAANNNDPSAVWDTMPSSMQNDIDLLAQDLGNRMPDEFYNSAWELIRRVTNLLEDKREFILNTPIAQMGFFQSTAKEKAQFISTYDSIVPVLNSLASSQISSTKRMKSFNTSTFIANNGRQLTEAVISILNLAATQDQSATAGMQVWHSLSSLQVSILSENDSTAVVQTSLELPALFSRNGGDGVESISMTKVDDKWIPVDLYYGFTAAILEAKANLASTDFSVNSTEVMGMKMMVVMADTVLGPLEASNTQAEFNSAMQLLSNLFMR